MPHGLGEVSISPIGVPVDSFSFVLVVRGSLFKIRSYSPWLALKALVRTALLGRQS
jgi:hypothetical protein